jgi:hypothetical protein
VEGLVSRDACERLHGLLFGLQGYFFQKLCGYEITLVSLLSSV